MNNFLLSLPAILGIVAFVIYLILKKSVTQDPIVKAIIDKLKYEEPEFAHLWEGLNASQKKELLKQNNNVRRKLESKDRQILDNALTHQFRTNIFVYFLCGLLLVIGIYLFLKPKPLIIDNIQIQNTDSTNKDLLVDIDPVTVTWTSSGKDEEVYVTLENTETGKQTKKLRGQASDGSITFAVDPYTNFDKILTNRIPNRLNNIRVIFYAGSESFKSKPFALKVGVKVICYEELPNHLIFNAIVDQTIIDNFYFSPSLALFEDEHFNGQRVFESDSYSSTPSLLIDSPRIYKTNNLALSVNPRDIVNAKIYRTDIESIRDALKALQKK
ncbi:MAG: hypothetical protein QM731_08385 [Chitinophagaceae bacterium]